MEVAPAAPQTLWKPLRRGTPLPLGQLVEQSRSRANTPNRLLESKIFSKLKSNSLIEAEPPELHFSGFKLGKDYTKILKLINISSEVMNIHIIPTQTKHFQTAYTKKYRLIPGLAYTLTVRLCPDEWRYFYDCIRVHCKGEENLLIPVHAYPVIDDLHIPAHIDLSAVPLGQRCVGSVRRAIPLRCSCPVDFEFQVYVIEPHESFSIHPLTGVIPANGEEKILVTFTPLQYETCQVTIQLIILQFNSKPYLCTIAGSSAPHLTLSELESKTGHGDARPVESKGPSSPKSKTKYRLTNVADRSKSLTDHAGVKLGPKLSVDVCTPAGVAKMLIKGTDKLSSKDLREAISCGSTVVLQNRQMKEACFMKKVQQNVKDEQTNQLRWQVHLGKDPVSEFTRRQIAEEREIALHEYMVKRGDGRHEEDFAAGKPELSSKRVLCEAGQACEGGPSFQFHSSFQWELRRRVLRLFQQAARKMVIRCRMNRRLACLKNNMWNLPLAKKVEDESSCDLKISPDKVFPFAFPVFADENDPLAPGSLMPMPVEPVDVTVTTCVPFFKLQVPQHYKLMGYRPVSAWEAFNSYTPATLARPLRTGAPDELVPDEVRARSVEYEAPEGPSHDEDDDDEGEVKVAQLSFTAPEALLRPFAANPLRIFNPDPGLQTYKPTPKYLESDPEFHLCPLPRYTIPESNMCGRSTQTPHTQKPLDHKEVIAGLMTWKNFDSPTCKFLSKRPALTSGYAPLRSINYSTDTLPLIAPPPLPGPPDDLPPLMDTQSEGPGVQLTPEIIRAEFLCAEALVSNSNLTSGTTVRHQRELQLEATYMSELNQMGKRVMARLKHYGVTDTTTPGEDCE
uniref:cilia- and flagella-associated protein 221 isoform X1 n=1 Tax=Gasterosteus aculeatus aculeatus TaxID=481459 RepID=UPI001A97F910|nr:cilia- and flagella-associated protein 221 isoform X1 [Gasterosteus aculeatus aculeatus]XP_040032538.1 cilia- and flagella-associated protein 221 isoform X1 [Gasterosteus aculeatus aculeatus]